MREAELPGIGRKFQLDARSGDRLVVIVHDDGRRELYHFNPDDPDECQSVITLTDEEARQVAAVVGGVIYKPAVVENAEVVLDQLAIDWFRIDAAAPVAGRSIGDLRVRQSTGASVIAVIRPDHTNILNPGPDQVLDPGATVVVAGSREQVQRFKDLLREDA